MNTTATLLEGAMYLLAAFGAGAALAGIYSVAKAFLAKQDQLYQQKHDEFLQQKASVEKHIKDTKPA